MATVSSSESRARRRFRSARPAHTKRTFFQRARRTLVVLFLASVAVVVAAPLVVARLPQRDRLLTWAAGIKGSIHLDSASLAWWSAPEVRGLELRDERGEVLLRLPKVAGSNALWRLAAQPRRLGKITLEKPEIYIRLYEDRADWQDVLQPWLQAPADPSTSALPVAEIVIADAQVTLVDEHLGRRTTMEGVDATIMVPDDASKPATVEARGTLAADGARGQWEMSAQLAHDKPQALADAGMVRAKLSGLPLSSAESILRRIAHDSRIAGALAGEFDLRWSPQAPHAGLAGWIEADSLDLAGPWFATGEALRLARLTADCRLAQSGTQVELNQAALACDLGEARASGSFDLDKAWLEMLSSDPSQISAKLDVARLAAALPRTLKLREETQIKSGTLEARLVGQEQAGQILWQGELATSQIAVVQAGREFALEQPLTVSLSAQNGADGLRIERLAAQSKFLHVTAGGTLENLHANATFDLARLDDELQQVIDLGDIELSGDGWGNFDCQRDDSGRLAANGELQIRNLNITGGDFPAWTEKQVLAHLTLSGEAREGRVTRVDAARIEAAADTARMTAQLVAPVADPAQGPWPVTAELDGQLAAWAPRLQSWIPALAGYDLAGNCRAQAQVAWSPSAIELIQLQAAIGGCKLVGGGWWIDEPALELRAERGRYDASQARLDLAKANLKAQAIEVEATNIAWRGGESDAEIAGNLVWRGDVARLQRWRDDPQAPSAVRWAGLWRGQLQAQRKGKLTDARLDSVIDEWVAQSPGGAKWQEKQVRLAGHVAYDEAQDSVALTECSLASHAVNLAAQGGVNDLDGARDLRLDGRIDYDLEKLQPLIQQQLGEGVKLVGRESRQFSLRGPLGAAAGPAGPPQASAGWAKNLQGQAGFGWQSGSLYGLPLGPANLQARLGGGVARLDPLDLAVSGGRLKLQADLRLDPAPAELTIPVGASAKQIQITPEMCDAGLKFVAPVLAGVTRAEGQFSVDLDRCRLPLADPKTGDVAGRFTVHQVTIGAGPLLQELAVLLQRPTEARLQQESVVPFQLYQGRIYHRDLQLVFPEFTIRTYGSVGLDQSLALMAELPVPPKWIGGNPLGQALTNQTIKLPIGGTLAAPKLDQQSLAQASAQFVRDSATNLLQKEVGKQLDKLFAPR